MKFKKSNRNAAMNVLNQKELVMGLNNDRKQFVLK